MKAEGDIDVLCNMVLKRKAMKDADSHSAKSRIARLDQFCDIKSKDGSLEKEGIDRVSILAYCPFSTSSP